MEFPLPKPTQDSFSRWYMQKVDTMEIVYPGTMLPCSGKHRQLKKMLLPQHVFIMRNDVGAFFYYLLGNDNVFVRLTKRYYTVCFSNIQLNSIRSDNRINVYLTTKTCVELPFIPDDFLKQKRTRRTPSTRGKNKRLKKQHTYVKQENNEPFRGWMVCDDASVLEERPLTKATLFQTIFAVLRHDQHIPHPFQDKYNLDDILNDPASITTLKTIIAFVKHYATAECGMLETPPYCFTNRLKLLVHET